MEFEDIIKQMRLPSFFGSYIKSITEIQTHISHVFLTGNYAYKIKKPVNYGFLDFSTLEKRKYYLEKELNLNKRLCPDIYLEVLPITKNNDNIELNGTGKVIEYTLKMKEFSQDKIMTNILKNSKINKKIIDKLNNKLISFYNSTDTSEEINNYGRISQIKKNISENFKQTKEYINNTIDEETYFYIKKIVEKFLSTEYEFFEKRIKSNKIKDCHGDLHSGNIVILEDDIYIFDCIEFNERFRYSDIASDIAFLAMDLDYHNYPFLSSYFIYDYIQKTEDFGVLEILNFYKSYRAYVRGKVIGFNLNNKIDNKQYNQILDQTKKYFELSKYYSSLNEIAMYSEKPILIIIFGLTGTGKSTLSSKLSVDYNARIVNTDVVRKKNAGIDLFEKHYDEINSGLYSKDNQYNNYLKVIKESDKILNSNNNMIIDATFLLKRYRDLVYDLAENHKIKPIFIQCIPPDEIVKKWLDMRVKTKSVSDGRWEVFEMQKNTFEPMDRKDNYIKIDMSLDSYDDRLKNFLKIQNCIKGVFL